MTAYLISLALIGLVVVAVSEELPIKAGQPHLTYRQPSSVEPSRLCQRLLSWGKSTTRERQYRAKFDKERRKQPIVSLMFRSHYGNFA